MPRYWSQRGAVYSPEERRQLIDRYEDAWHRRDGGDERAAGNMAAAVAEYVAATPIVSLSRCPFTGEVFETSLDIFGIDGMWWAADYDHRPYVQPLPTFFAWTGAMQMDGPVPNRPWRTMVGPSAPFVLPRILSHDHVRAVVSSILVGEHVGFPVVYYARPVPRDLERVDDWGHAFHMTQRPDGTPATAHATEYDPDKDIDLAPWIASGKLSWIAPGDLELTLRDDAACPFLDVGGDRRRQYVQDGRVWVAEDRDFGR